MLSPIRSTTSNPCAFATVAIPVMVMVFDRVVSTISVMSEASLYVGSGGCDFEIV